MIVWLEVNGKNLVKETRDREEAERVAEDWLIEAKKHYPHKKFTPRFIEEAA